MVVSAVAATEYKYEKYVDTAMKIITTLLSGLMWCSAGICLSAEYGQVGDVCTDVEEFTNPIVDGGADPWVIRGDSCYYLSGSDGNTRIFIRCFRKLSEMKHSQGVLVYDAANDSLKLNNLWGPHINCVNGEWYIYFCAQQNVDKSLTSQRMWVLKSESGTPFGPYVNKGEVLRSQNKEWAIDGSVLQKKNGELYFVWSGIERQSIADGSLHQKIFIARMLDPTQVDRSTITLIASPTEPWETSAHPILEGSRPLYVDENGKTILMYSANASWTDEYCLGSLTNVDGDFLNASAWKKSSAPLFQKTDSVYGPGGASYVKTFDGKEDWIIYHAARSKGAGWIRNLRAQRFTWDAHHNPIFGKPLAPGVKMQLPSGE